MTAKKEENGDESLYADKTYQVKVNMSRDCITKHIFVGDTRIASRVTFNDLTHSDNEEIRGVYYYHPDHLGNTTFVSDYRGEEYQHLEYTPYGETWVEESDNNKYINYKFTGKELDEETGLYYFGARYYDSKTSVFMSADPIYDGVKEGFGVYTYCRNNPLIYHDPTGLKKSDLTDKQWNKVSSDITKAKDSVNKMLNKLKSIKNERENINKEIDSLNNVLSSSNDSKIIKQTKNQIAKLNKKYNDTGIFLNKWFGDSSDKTLDKLVSDFTKIQDGLTSLTRDSFVYNNKANHFAWVSPFQLLTKGNKIELGNAYFSASNTGWDTGFGTLIHEMSHLKIGTSDKGYGFGNPNNLINLDNRKKKENADNYEYAVEDLQ